MPSPEIMLRELKLANDLLGNCGIAQALADKYPTTPPMELFLNEYKKYLKAALRMFDEVLKESSRGAPDNK